MCMGTLYKCMGDSKKRSISNIALHTNEYIVYFKSIFIYEKIRHKIEYVQTIENVPTN